MSSHHQASGLASGNSAHHQETNMANERLIPNENWQTQQRGTNDQEYQIYVAAAESLGWKVKTYDEWLAS